MDDAGEDVGFEGGVDMEDAGEDTGEDVGFEGGVDMEDVREGRVEVLGDGLGECVGAGIGFGDEGGISGVEGVEAWG